MSTALVTGASRGLGATFAKRLAQAGFDLVIVARDRSMLERVAIVAQAHGVAVEILVADLTVPAQRRAVESRLADHRLPVDVLVNNAGVECDDEFAAADAEDLIAEIDLNITAVMQLTHAALPGMIDRGRGTIINIASFAGYLPAAGSAYGATKAWVLAFTDTIESTLTGTGVAMIAVCAGRMRTGKQQAPTSPSPLWLDPDAVIDTCFRDLSRGRSRSTPGWLYHALVAFLELPRTSLRTAARLAGQGRRQRPPSTTSARPATPMLVRRAGIRLLVGACSASCTRRSAGSASNWSAALSRVRQRT